MIGSPVHRWAIAVAAGSVVVLLWHAAINGELIVAPPPGVLPSGTPDETMAAHFAWLRGIAFHDLGVRVLGAMSFFALAGLGHAMTSVHATAGTPLGAGKPMMAASGRILVVAGLFGALGQLVEFGGHQAAIAASRSLAPAAMVGLIQFFVDQVGGAITTSAWAIFGVAALVGALAMRGGRAVPGVILGMALLVMAGSRLFDDPAEITESLLLVAGIALIPLWALSLVWLRIEPDVRIGQPAA